MAEPDPAPYEDRGYVLCIIIAFTLALALVLLCCRFYVRIKVTKNPGLDDVFISLAMMIAMVAVGMASAAVYHGLGKHIYSLSPEHIHQAVKWSLIQSLPLGLAAMCTKISIFIFLRRIFLTTQTKWTWTWSLHFINGVNIVANLASATTELAQCTPVTKLWDPAIPGSCWTRRTQAAIGIFQGATSIFCDFAFSLIPIVFLWNVHINYKIKIGICSLMGLGFFTAVCATVRTVLANTESFEDFTYDDLTWNIWIYLETLLGIVAACLPTIRPLLKTQLIKSYLSKYSSTGLPKRRHAGVRGSDRQDPLGYKGSSNRRNTPARPGFASSETEMTVLV